LLCDDAAVTDPLAGRCGSCAHFHSERWDAERNATMGECGHGTWPRVRPDTSSCPDYVAEGTLRFGLDRTRIRAARPTTTRSTTTTQTPARRLPVEIEVDMDEATFRAVLREVLRDELALGDVAIAERFRGGEMVLKPGKEGTAEKRIPLEGFFHKIVMLRDKLRVLEQKLNAHPRLTDDEKVSLQQYVTGCYGTLTTFNVLFREEDDRFRGGGGEG
jgi:hypothetical protein